jgi:leucyl-tRNA synthetase
VRLDDRVVSVEMTLEQSKVVARTVAAVTADYEGLRYNTALSRLMEFVNFFTSQEARPQKAMEAFTLMLSPMAPHIAEELWHILGNNETLAFEPWPEFDPALLVEEQVEVPVQINGKLRGRVLVPTNADAAEIERAAAADSRIGAVLEGKTVRKVVVVPGKLVNFVLG